MNMRFIVTDKDKYTDLIGILDDSKIEYKVVDRDTCTLGFKVAKEDADDFQRKMAGEVIGSRVPGYFEVEE
jgi:hypothetical protein